VNGKTGYFHSPTIVGSKVAFVSEDDLWVFDTQGDTSASRLTASEGRIATPVFSPDGNKIAYSSNEFGSFEVYLIDLTAGSNDRLTYLGSNSIARSWNPATDEIIFETNYGSPTRATHLFSVPAEGGEPKKLPFGVATTINYGTSGEIVLGRFQNDNARWKRYKGGRTGQIWISLDGQNFKLLELPQGNHVTPRYVGGRVFFLSDYEGVSNLYSVLPDGSDLKRLTDSSEFYFRNLSSDTKHLIMQKAGQLYTYNPENNVVNELDVPYFSSREFQKEKFVNASKFLEIIQINSTDDHALVISRGKPYYFPFWEEGVYQIGQSQGIRYKCPVFHPSEEILYLVSDKFGEDGIEIYNLKKLNAEPDFIGENIGVPYSMKINRDGTHLALFNNRQEVILIDIKQKTSKVLHRQEYNSVSSISWSPDGKWLTWSNRCTLSSSKILVYSLVSEKIHEVTEGDFTDSQPKFDPEGKYLYFMSNRTFKPMIDSQLFQYNFPKSTKIYVIPLQKDIHPPNKMKPRPLKDTPDGNKKPKNEEGKKEDAEKTDEAIVVSIDFDAIHLRITELPIPEDRITNYEVTKDRILFSTAPIKGMGDLEVFSEPPTDISLKGLSLKDLEIESVMEGITQFALSSTRKTIIVYQGKKVRLLTPDHSAKMEQKGKGDAGLTRKSKYLDLSRIKVKVDPVKEWDQMLKETWKLMKEHYWEPNMGGIDWERILETYLDLVQKVGSRYELSDLIWEMIGETGTSHAYEWGGDYKFPPNYTPAYLGADFQFDTQSGGYKITHIVKGDYWNPKVGSPLVKAGINLQEGDIILSINGQQVSAKTTVQELLMGKVKQEVYLQVLDAASGQERTVISNTLPSDSAARYRDWVEKNRHFVHSETQGKVGYVHVPDMMISGANEFFRYLKIESQREALIVDVRYNGGGHISQLVLEKLARKRLGYGITRYGKPSVYPAYSIPGPMIAITNESAGSDGDIFSHYFKLMKLGKLIGTRTWGGVVGIWPKVRLVDRSMVTQPEYAGWYSDVGWDVENYGTDPDIQVMYSPNDYIADRDPQLQKAIETILLELETNPVHMPNFDDKPSKKW
jgi:tricorn protease